VPFADPLRAYLDHVTSEMGKVEDDERTHAVKPAVNGRRALWEPG
jgi:hypothetical protein